jgi:thiamine-phosphate pyrophosphorylase
VQELTSRRLYLCTPLRDDLASFVRAVMRGGVDVLQLRAKDADDRTILRAARECAAIARDANVPFLLNDRPDLALDVNADGVHVGQEDAPVALCRRILGDDALIGLSTHASADLDGALREDVTYLSAGPVEATPTKPGRPGTGVAYAVDAQRRSPWPVFVTGGVTPEGIEPLWNAGIRHFVVVRYLTTARDPENAARQLRAAIDARSC